MESSPNHPRFFYEVRNSHPERDGALSLADHSHFGGADSFPAKHTASALGGAAGIQGGDATRLSAGAHGLETTLEMQDPQTDAEWKEAADSAYFMLLLDSCYQYGLMTGPKVNVERCEWILEEAKKRGIVPERDVKL